MNKNNIVRAAGVLSLVASLLLGPLTPLAQAAAGPWPSVNGLSAPTVLLVNEMGSWTVKASESDNSPLSYAADWGDASAAQPASTNPTLTHAYSAPGTYTVNLTVENGGGFTSHESATVLVENPQGAPLVISNVAATSTGPTSEQITWSTNTRANSSLWLSTSTPVDISGAPSIIRSARVFHHSLTLKDLLPGTTYFAVAGSRDFNRNTATSSEISFSTPSAISPLTAPTDLSSTSTTESSTVLSWTASTGGVTPITYAVMQDGVVVGTTTDTTFTDTGLSPSTTYNYVIEATDSATPTPGVADSSAVTATTLPASAPTIASVDGPSSLVAGAEGTWTLGASDPENGTLTYSVDWGDTPAGALLRRAAMVIQTSTFSHTYAAAGTYNIVFTATNEAGLSTTATTSVTVTPATSPLTAPTDLSSTSTTESSTILSWTASTGGVTPITYAVMRDGTAIGTTTDTTFTDTGLSPSTTYSYVIEATDSATPTPGVADSSALSVTTPAAAAQTFTLAEIAAHNTASDCWTAINGSVYNLTSFIDSHPGGVANITSICGIDGATLFNAIHGNDSTAQAALVPLKIGILAA